MWLSCGNHALVVDVYIPANTCRMRCLLVWSHAGHVTVMWPKFVPVLQMKGLHFKHTDNFNFWLATLRHVGLPKVTYVCSLVMFSCVQCCVRCVHNYVSWYCFVVDCVVFWELIMWTVGYVGGGVTASSVWVCVCLCVFVCVCLCVCVCVCVCS